MTNKPQTMEIDHRAWLWRLLSKERDTPDVPALIEVARSHNVTLSPGDLWALGTRLGGGAGGEAICPPAVSDLVVAMLNGVAANEVLDPWVGFGTLLQPVVLALKPKRFVGVYPNPKALDVARMVLPEGHAGTYACACRPS